MEKYLSHVFKNKNEKGIREWNMLENIKVQDF